MGWGSIIIAFWSAGQCKREAKGDINVGKIRSQSFDVLIFYNKRYKFRIGCVILAAVVTHFIVGST